jgi:DNA-binding CsgD family transcriptional regulator
MIPEVEVLSDLIGTIYDTTLDRTLWSRALRKSAEFVGGSAAAIYSKNLTAGNGNVYYESGTDPYYRQLYLDKYVKLSPSTIAHYLTDVEQVFAIADIMPYQEFLETRFYKEWAKPQCLVDFIAAVLDKSGSSVAPFVVFRDERNGVIDAETRRRMRLIVPHIRRAVLIGNVMDLNQADTTVFADALSGLAAGVFLVDENARVVSANRSGQIMLEEKSILRQRGCVLTTVNSRVGPTLPEIIALARDGDTAVGVNGIALPLSSPPEPWLAHILPLTSGIRRDAGIAYSAVAAVFVHKASIEIPSAMETMSKLYKLTPSELRVLAALSEVGGVPAVAEVVGISQATVKTHLQGLFAKTGTNRQAELVKLVAAHASPLRQAP